ncbi:ABC transporter substrate-binding protein [Sphingomicrobium sediminis]|uniref:ABC transporter substrate-binding protein n=1 Tax=Sphingomicrobium sediminis TaxID=2950949 RepID=A0A9X2J1K4_9SPHN|nr:ABC transporter substrate-binding protein [Sphingomicrobium sediminis]MCM8557363.1 ABC transporter substrate-binding protein [Sphingomicrobium sediminis]
MQPLTTRLLPLALAALLAGCGSNVERETHVVLVEGGPDDTSLEQMVAMAERQGLVRFDAGGDIVPALARSWHVSDDGRSYIFRLEDGSWPDGSDIEAEDVAAALRATLADDENDLADMLGAIRDIRAMTDRVIEIRLNSPRPHFLQLLAQPALGVTHGDMPGGPFRRLEGNEGDGVLVGRLVPRPRSDEMVEQQVRIEADTVGDAIARFLANDVDMVTGGGFSSLPLAREASGLFGGPRLDPVHGLFGLVPVGDAPLFAGPEVRRALSDLIDRAALASDLGLPVASARANILDSNVGASPEPEDTRDIDERRDIARDLLQEAGLGGSIVRIALPDGPGSALLYARLAADWGTVGLLVERGEAEDATLALIDKVAPAQTAAWYLRQFRCDLRAICNEEADTLLAEARAASSASERAALLGRAAQLMDADRLFFSLGTPVRWSLVDQDMNGFTPNRFARHFPGALRRPSAASR